MTNREKALEALNRLYQSHSENSFAPFPTRSDLDAISLELHKPSFEDAVKVVEERLEELDGLDGEIMNAAKLRECRVILNLLRERGKGK